MTGWLLQEATVLSTSSLEATQELHNIRAHQLYYASLLEDFRKTVKFIRDTRNPAIDSDGIPAATRARNAELMERECSNLMDEIDRLDLSRKMLDKQLRNVMNLVGAYLNWSGLDQLMFYRRCSMLSTLMTADAWEK